MKSKVSEHMSKIEKAQKELENQIEAARVAAEASLTEKNAKLEENKNLQMEGVLKKIKEHQDYVNKVRDNQDEMLRPKVEELQTKIQIKEEKARERREKIESEMRDKMAEQNRRAEIVRQNKEKLQLEENLDQTNESA